MRCIAGVFGEPALLDGKECEVKLAIGLPSCRSQHDRCCGICPLQRRKPEFGGGIGMFQRIDQIFSRIIAGQFLALAPSSQ